MDAAQDPPESDVPEIEIRDPEEDQGEPNGYSRGLLVPLVVVPAMIVMLGVLIVALFGLVSGSESTPADNLNTLLEGGANERQQAAFALVGQMLEYQHAKAEGREPIWNIDEQDFLKKVSLARSSLPEPTNDKETWEPFVLSSILAEFGDPDGVRQLAEATRYPDTLDPEFQIRTNAIFVLGSIGRDLDEGSREVATEALLELVAGADEGLTLLAAGALQNLPSPAAREALVGLLDRRRLDVRLQAALSLAEMGDTAGVDVLRALVAQEPYLEERELHPDRWASQDVSTCRRKALEALSALDRLPAADELQRLVDEDSDPNVQAAARDLLAGRPGV